MILIGVPDKFHWNQLFCDGEKSHTFFGKCCLTLFFQWREHPEYLHWNPICLKLPYHTHISCKTKCYARVWTPVTEVLFITHPLPGLNSTYRISFYYLIFFQSFKKERGSDNKNPVEWEAGGMLIFPYSVVRPMQSEFQHLQIKQNNQFITSVNTCQHNHNWRTLSQRNRIISVKKINLIFCIYKQAVLFCFKFFPPYTLKPQLLLFKTDL